MSTLVIIAHIKDGADLARQHRLPQPIIDLIVQHHGTTRVEFFYGRATEQKQTDPNGGEVDESNYRYPGPKPQTKEAAVLMLADAVESASRTLVDPTPARIESLDDPAACPDARRLYWSPVQGRVVQSRENHRIGGQTRRQKSDGPAGNLKTHLRKGPKQHEEQDRLLRNREDNRIHEKGLATH